MSRFTEHPFSRRRLLAGTAAAAVGGVLGSPGPALADADADLSHLRLQAAAARLTITFYTRWLDGPSGTGSTRALAHRLRAADEAHYAALAAILGPATPVDSDFTYTLPRKAFATPAAAATLGARLEKICCGIAIDGAAEVAEPGARELLARIAASDSSHATLLRSLTGGRPGSSLPEPLSEEAASAALAPYLTT